MSSPTVRVPAGVAAHAPQTAAVGVAVLEDGGSAVDAAVAMALAACAAETTMTGLGGGGHAVVLDPDDGRVVAVDGFVTVPGLGGPAAAGSERVVVPVRFERTVDPYEVGMASVGVPGVPALCGALHRRWGRLPWPRLVEPARRLAAEGVPLPPTHARVLLMLEAALARGEGSAVYRRDGRLLDAGDVVRVPGLADAFGVLAEEGAGSFARGALAEALLGLVAERGGALSRADLEAYAVQEHAPAFARLGRSTVHAREALHSVRASLERLPADLAGRDAASRAPLLARALDDVEPALLGTTNVTAVDADGGACVVTTSLGLGSGDWLPGLGVHLNSMLGEPALADPPLPPGARVRSDMSPLVATDGAGLVLAAGAGGGSRIRSALVQAVLGAAVDGLPAAEAVAAPRLHPMAPVVHLEPGYPPAAEDALRQAGWQPQRWDTRHHFFGGVSLVGRTGAAGDDRRDGAAALLGG